MKFSLKLSALLLAAGSPAFALADSSSSAIAAGGELSLAVFAATGLVLMLVSDYHRRTVPLSLPAAKPRLGAAEEAFAVTIPTTSRGTFVHRRVSAMIGS